MIICLAGPRASGKTTTAKCLADHLGWPLLSFGDYVREVARKCGLDPHNLVVLQNLGLELIEEGWDNFCSDLLTFYGYNKGNAVIDGIRHTEAVNTLSTITKERAFLVYLDVPEAMQNERMRQRNRGDYKGNQNHFVEKQVKNEVRENSGMVIDADIPPEEIVQLIVQYLSQ